MKKICVITGSRSEYDLLSGIMREISNDKDLKLQIVATCMHLSNEFGLTYKQIEEDGFIINKKIETLLSSDTPAAISKSIGLGLIGFSDAFKDLNPDLILLLGDRFETFAAATASLVAGIPVAHLHGGEVTQGSIDESFRHAITKMSHLHFCATDVYKQRIIQLGEKPENIFNVGAPGVENISKLNLLSKTELENAIDFKLGQQSILVTFHPSANEINLLEEQLNQLLEALNEMPELRIIFTKANSDSGGRTINQRIDEFVKLNTERVKAFHSMGKLYYLSAVKHVNAVVGNSSSGIIEAPSLHTTTINIGDRQEGRCKADSIIDCAPIKSEIKKALASSLASKSHIKVQNPYEKKNTSKLITKIIKDTDLNNIVKKRFHDLVVT